MIKEAKKHKIGNLAEFKFRTLSGYIWRAGLLTAQAGNPGSTVWDVQGLNGKYYRIHEIGLEPVGKEEKK